MIAAMVDPNDIQGQEEDISEESPLDHLFSALKHFARASGGGREAKRAGEAAPSSAGRFGSVKKSCCLARRNK